MKISVQKECIGENISQEIKLIFLHDIIVLQFKFIDVIGLMSYNILVFVL